MDNEGSERIFFHLYSDSSYHNPNHLIRWLIARKSLQFFCFSNLDQHILLRLHKLKVNQYVPLYGT